MTGLSPYAAFLDELEKIALVQKSDAGERTEITDSIKEFVGRLEPGDIIASKGSLGSGFTFGAFTAPVQRLRGKSRSAFPWGHAGVYIGDGKIRHAYSGIQGKVSVGAQRVRDHSVQAFAGLGRDMIALRPKVSENVREKAVARTKDLLGLGFDYLNIVRAGFFAKGREKDETKKENLPGEVICTSVVGYAYPKLRFKGKSIHTLMPADIVDHRKMKPVMAYSADKLEPLLDKVSAVNRSYLKDWMGGVDPTGGYTFQYGMQDAPASESEARTRRLVGTAGGLIGGGIAVPSAIYAAIHGAKGFAQGGVRGALRGVVSGVKHPVASPYRAWRAKQSLRGINAGVKATVKDVGRISKVVGETGAPTGYLQMLKSDPEQAARMLSQAPQQQKAEALQNVSGKLTEGLAALGLSSGISGGAAYLQYGKGRGTGKVMNQEQRDQVAKV